MAVSRRSPGRLSSAGEERTLRRVVIVERDAHQRALLGKELSRRDIAVQGLSDEQVLLDTPGALRHADVIVLGQTRSIASALSLSVRLNDAGIRVPIVNLTGRQTARSGSGESADHVGPALRIDDMLRDLKQLVRTIRQQAGPPSGDVVRGALTLRSDGTALWKDIEVPLTPADLCSRARRARCTGSGRGLQANQCPVGRQAHSAEIPRLRPHVSRDQKS